MGGSSQQPTTARRRSTAVAVGLLLITTITLTGFNLGANSLHNQDEAKHAVVAREAAVDGHWLPLTYNGRPYFSKPPLRIWLTALTYKLAGIHEWSVRAWSAIAAIATVLMLYLVGRPIYGARAGFFAALALATSHLYLYNHCARTGETDALLIFFLSTGLLLLQLALAERRPGWLYIAAALLGLCGITKHLGFVPIVLAIALGSVLVTRSWRALSFRSWMIGLGILLGTALPWHLVLWALEGQRFIDGYFLREVVEKRLESAAGGQSAARLGQWVSIETFARGFFPWSCLLPFAAFILPVRDERRQRWLLPLIWLAVILATTVITVQKFTWYVLPAFPAAALLVGGLIDRFLDRCSTPRTWLAVLLGALVGLASTTSAAVFDPFGVAARQSMLSVWPLARLQKPDSPTGTAILRLLAITALLCLVYWALGRWRRNERLHSVARRLVVAALALQALWIASVPLKFSRQQSPLHRMAVLLDDELKPGEPVYVALAGRKAFNPLFQFYIGRYEVRRFEPAEFDPGRWAGAMLLTDGATLPSLRGAPARLGQEPHLVGRARGLLLVRIPATGPPSL